DWSANGYRLPTEAEWEYACRAGTVSAFNTGAAISDNTGWCLINRINSNFITHEGGKKSANAWGLYDMHGNVFEWVWDWFESNYSPGTSDPRGPASGSSRVSRGGGIFSPDYDLRSAARTIYSPGVSGEDLGFRLAASGSGGSK
ncbi:MAG: formylglycine-generating enzyme family protein, partial [Spirochaetaceae bacterium]|nr:formylglycine-generating enzyme family protein [Spirochaetaceae bacterium]